MAYFTFHTARCTNCLKCGSQFFSFQYKNIHFIDRYIEVLALLHVRPCSLVDSEESAASIFKVKGRMGISYPKTGGSRLLSNAGTHLHRVTASLSPQSRGPQTSGKRHGLAATDMRKQTSVIREQELLSKGKAVPVLN
jgi:hypothetical protein